LEFRNADEFMGPAQRPTLGHNGRETCLPAMRHNRFRHERDRFPAAVATQAVAV
jgi:hypothetical protein